MSEENKQLSAESVGSSAGFGVMGGWPAGWVVDKIVLEYWDRYADVPHRQYAEAIAAMLLAQGETVRISEKRADLWLGEAMTPND